MSTTANLPNPVNTRVAVADDTFAAMLDTHSPTLKGFARRLTSGAPEADDLLQDTLLKGWSARRTFIAGTNFSAWSRAVMRNSFLSSRRHDQFWGDLPQEAFDRLEGMPGGQDNALLLRDLVWALKELNEEQRGAVLLSSEGATTKEGALHFAISSESYKTRVFRGRQRLRYLVENGPVSMPYKATLKTAAR